MERLSKEQADLYASAFKPKPPKPAPKGKDSKK